MAEITVTAAQVGLVDPLKADVGSFIAAVAITKGQAVYFNTSGKAALATAATQGTAQFRGIALNTVGAGEAVDVLHDGLMYGAGVSALNGDAAVYVAGAAVGAGGLQTTAATIPTIAGRVVVLTDGPTRTKVVRIQTDWLRAWTS
jgi:hypothetical protein